MAAKRIDMHRLQELVRLHRMGASARKIAQSLRMGRNTMRGYLAALAEAGVADGPADDLPALEVLCEAVRARLPERPSPQQTSSVEQWEVPVREMLERGAGPRAIYDCLRLRESDFTGSLSAIKRLCLRIKKADGVKAEDVAIPVETEPGDVAQVDFGFAGRLYDPITETVRRAWVFVMTLGYSRHMWADIVFDQRVDTWLSLHVRAFQALGGVPRVIVPDNLKAAVIRAAFGASDNPALNRSYREMARHYGFKIDPTPPRSPQKKGKVEAGVRYVRGNFFRPRELSDMGGARAELSEWLTEIAGKRIHAVTGRRPLEVFESEEKAALLPLPKGTYERVIWKKAKVHRDSHVIYEKRLYSVPWQHLGEEVWIRATPTSLTIYRDDERIATHSRRGTSVRSTDDSHLPDRRADLRHRSRSYWENRAQKMGDEVATLIRAVFESDDVLYNIRPVQAIVTHLEQHPRPRARAACARALHYGSFGYREIKNILLKGLDYEPLPETNTPDEESRPRPRYARSPADQLIPNLEETHGRHR